MKSGIRPRLAVLIDADNIAAKHTKAIIDEVTKLGDPALRRVYGDWSRENMTGWAEATPKYGLVAHQVSANTVDKNANDIGLVIDAMDILHTGRYDGFVLVSSDSDFTALANRIREQGLTVTGIGEAKAPESLRNVCNRFILIKNIVDKAPNTPTGLPCQSKKTPHNGAIKLIKSAMEEIDRGDDWVDLSILGKQILATNSNFSTHSYGCKNLSSLICQLSGFETKKSGQRLRVKIKS